MKNIKTTGIRLTGIPIKRAMIEQAKNFSDVFRDKKILIITANPPYEPHDPPPEIPSSDIYQQRSTKISTKLKQRLFEASGFEVEVARVPSHIFSPKNLHNYIASEQETATKRNRSLGVIIQRPFHIAAQVPTNLDLDPAANNGHFTGPVTAETIHRIVTSYLEKDDKVALVGGRGFIGCGVHQYLRTSLAESQIMIFEKGDDLEKVKQANIVVSVAGIPDLLDRRHISSHHKLVVTSGFVQGHDGSIKSDIAKEALDIPQAITPVPGGIGPLEMATLLERAASNAGVYLEPWHKSELWQEITQDRVSLFPSKIVRQFTSSEEFLNHSNSSHLK